MLSCIFDDDPCIFIENMPSYWTPGAAPEPGVRIPLRKAHIVRPGSDVTLISYSRILNDCVAVAEKLAGEKIGVEIMDLRTIAPLDSETILASVAKTRRAVIVHEAMTPFGVGAEIAARLHRVAVRQAGGAGRAGGCALLCGAVLEAAGDRVRAESGAHRSGHPRHAALRPIECRRKCCCPRSASR